MKSYPLFIVLFLILAHYTSFAQTVQITVYPELMEQKITSMGGNYAQANYTSSAWDDVGEATLRDFRPSHVRLALPLQFRGTPYTDYKGEKINAQPTIQSLHETMQRMKNEYGVKNFTISVWR